MSKRIAASLAVCSILASLAGCDGGKSAPGTTTASPSPSNTGSATEPARASASASPSAAPTAPSSATADGAELVGAWEGSYDAKKSSVALPARVKPDALGADDGKTAVGAGTVQVIVAAGGDVRGKLGGALGTGTIFGRAEGGMLRASIRPDDPRAPLAMTGVLIGMGKADGVVCELHVAGPDGGTIRESVVVLKRKP